MKVKFNCTYTMSLDEKSGKVKCGILRKIEQIIAQVKESSLYLVISKEIE